MANVFPDRTREWFADPWLTEDIKVVLVDDVYAYDAGHDNLDDVLAARRVATSANLASKTVTGGWLDAADVTFSGIAAAEDIAGLWIYEDSGSEATSRLLMWFDTDDSSTAIAVTTTGADVQVIWPSAGIARI